MKTAIYIAIALFSSLQFMSADAPIDLTQAYEDSELWSAYLTLEQDVAVDGHELTKGTRAVLIRLVRRGEDFDALLDFGRHGIHAIPVASTDLLVQAQGIQNGLSTKRIPNLSGLLYSRLIKVEGAIARRYKIQDVVGLDQFVCVHMMDTTENWVQLADELIALRSKDLSAKVEIVLFLDAEWSLTDTEMLSRIQDYEIANVSYLYSFLSQDYMRILWTGLPKSEKDIEMLYFDVNGKLLDRVQF